MGQVWLKRGVFAFAGLCAWCCRSRWIGWWHGAVLTNAGREPPRGGQTSATPWHDCRSGRQELRLSTGFAGLPQCGATERRQRGVLHPAPERRHVFISYSHADRGWVERIRLVMAPLLMQQGKALQLWDDSQIEPGDRWLEEIEAALANARVALLLVSAEFLASEFVMGREVPALLRAAEAEGVRVLWVPLSASLVRHTAIHAYQALLPPEQALDALDPPQQRLALVRIAESVHKALEQAEKQAKRQELERRQEQQRREHQASAAEQRQQAEEEARQRQTEQRAAQAAERQRRQQEAAAERQRLLDARAERRRLLIGQGDGAAEGLAGRPAGLPEPPPGVGRWRWVAGGDRRQPIRPAARAASRPSAGAAHPHPADKAPRQPARAPTAPLEPGLVGRRGQGLAVAAPPD
jgi:hypothetical protein